MWPKLTVDCQIQNLLPASWFVDCSFVLLGISIFNWFVELLIWNGVCIYPTPPPRAECDIVSIFKRIKDGLNSEFSFS